MPSPADREVVEWLDRFYEALPPGLSIKKVFPTTMRDTVVAYGVWEDTGDHVVVKMGLRGVSARLVENEARILRLLQPLPVVPRFYYSSGKRGARIVVMEYVGGRSLAARSPMGAQRALEMAFYSYASLCHIHGRGVVHRDFKPENLVPMGPRGIVVLDYGIACRAGEGSVIRAGTPGYSCPEAFQGGGCYPGCDVHSLPGILYKLASGSNPPAEPAKALQALRQLGFPAGLQGLLQRLVEERREAGCVGALEALVRAHAGLAAPRIIIDGVAYPVGYGVQAYPLGHYSQKRLVVVRRPGAASLRTEEPVTRYRCGAVEELEPGEHPLESGDILVAVDESGRTHYAYYFGERLPPCQGARKA